MTTLLTVIPETVVIVLAVYGIPFALAAILFATEWLMEKVADIYTGERER